MSDKPAFWFPVKQYGWGWGLPVRWQGWVVFVSYLALLYAAIYYFTPRRAPIGLSVSILMLTAVLVVIVAAKGERPLRWRWGKD